MSLQSAEVDEVRTDSQNSSEFEVGSVNKAGEVQARADSRNSSGFEVGSVNEYSVHEKDYLEFPSSTSLHSAKADEVRADSRVCCSKPM